MGMINTTFIIEGGNTLKGQRGEFNIWDIFIKLGHKNTSANYTNSYTFLYFKINKKELKQPKILGSYWTHKKIKDNCNLLCCQNPSKICWNFSYVLLFLKSIFEADKINRLLIK